MTVWLALGPVAGGVRGILLDGDKVTSSVEGPDEAAVLSQLGQPDQIIRIGEGHPATLPAPVLPDGGVSLPGWQQANPPDVIGAWVRLWVAGFLALNEGWDGVTCAVAEGISHWIHLSAGEAVSCQSFLTPGLIASLGGSTVADPGAVSDSMSRPERLAAHLRQAQVTADSAALTGHLIGAELAAARPYWLGQQVAVIAKDATAWTDALGQQGVACTAQNPDTMEKAGLAALASALGLSG